MPAQVERKLVHVLTIQRPAHVISDALALENAPDDIKHLLGFQFLADGFQFIQQYFDDFAFAGLARNQVDDEHFRFFLAVTVNATHALFQPRRIPRHVIIHHHPAELQIDAFAGRIRANHDARPAILNRLFEKRDLLTALDVIHAAVDAGDLTREAQAVQPAFEICHRVPVLREHQQLLIAKPLVLDDAAQFFKLRFVPKLLHLTCQHQQFRDMLFFDFQIGDGGRDKAAKDFTFGTLILLFAVALLFLISGATFKRIVIFAQPLRLFCEFHQINAPGHHVLNHAVQLCQSPFHRAQQGVG